MREEKPPSALGANLSFVRELQEMKVEAGWCEAAMLLKDTDMNPFP